MCWRAGDPWAPLNCQDPLFRLTSLHPRQTGGSIGGVLPLCRTAAGEFYPRPAGSNKQENIDILTNDWPDENELDRTILYPIDRLENLSVSTSDELICLLEDQENITENTCNKPVVSERGSETNTEQLFNEARKNLKANNKVEKVLTFLRLIVEGKFPLNNVAFLLFTDVVQWFSLDDVRQMRYSETTLKFFWLGKKLFGSRFTRFMSGPKNETDFLNYHRQIQR